MKNLFFASLFAVLFIFSYSCQDGENNQIENPQTQGIKKSTPDGEEIYNNIVNFRKKLLTQNYEVGESISTDEAILLMEASLNLTYGVRKDIESIEGESAVLNLDFGSENTEYSKIYTSYEEVLEKLRDIFRNLEGENKKFVAVDLNYDANRNELNIRSAISEAQINNSISDCDLPNQEIQFKKFFLEVREVTDAVTASYGIEDLSFYWKIDFFRAPDANPHLGDIAIHISEETKDSMRIVMAAHPNLLSDATYFVVEHLAWKPHTYFDPSLGHPCEIDNILINKCFAEDRGIEEYTELLFDYYYPLTDRRFLYATSPTPLIKVDSIPNYGVINYYVHASFLYFGEVFPFPEPVYAEDIFSDWNDIEN